jgi:ArsR family transcriptional regulator
MKTATINEHLLEKVAFILKTIAHPMRIGIIELLSKNDQLSVSEICEQLNLEQSLTSHHLLNMKIKGILASKREGKNIYYSIKLQEVKKIINCIENCDINPL